MIEKITFNQCHPYRLETVDAEMPLVDNCVLWIQVDRVAQDSQQDLDSRLRLVVHVHLELPADHRHPYVLLDQLGLVVPIFMSQLLFNYNS